MTTLADQTVLVTGAAKGIGAGVARCCAGSGARVGILDADADGAAALAGELGDVACALPADVRSYDEVARAAEQLGERFGPVTGVVANAGVGEYALVSEADPENWRRLLEINVLGAAHAVRAVLPEMKQRGAGRVVLMASVAGREAWAGEPMYIASKHALVGLGHSLRQECVSHGISVTLVEPAIVDTPLVQGTAEGRSELERFAALQPEDVGRAVVFALGQPAGVGVAEIVLRAIGPEL